MPSFRAGLSIANPSREFSRETLKDQPMKRFRVLPVLGGLFVPSLSLFAAATNDVASSGGSLTNAAVASPSVTLPEVTVTATRIPTAPADSPDSITVIPRGQIEQLQQQLVADVLRGEPGIAVARTGPPGTVDSVFLRGADSSQTLVLVDGIRVNNSFNNGFDFSQLSVDNIERIEILRGPQSTLYGSEAMGGVVNIVTRSGDGPPTGELETEYGSFNTLLEQGSFSAHEGKLSLAAAASYASSDNNRVNSDYEQYHFDGQLRYDFNERFSATLLTTYFHNDDGVPNDIYTDDPTARLKTEDALIGLMFQGKLTDWWDARLTLSHSHERGTYDQPANANNFDTAEFSQTIAQREQVDFQNIFKPSDQHSILVGGTIEDASANFSQIGTYGTNGVAKTIDTRSAYAQYDFMPVARLTLTAGGRVDDSTSFGTHETYRFGGRFTAPGTETIFRATVGTGYRAPSISDLYFPLYSNPNPKPETSTGWDAGFEQPLWQDKVRIGSTFFYNRFDNLIQYSGVSFEPENIGRARVFGVETYATWQPLDSLTLRGSYTWMNTEDLDTGMDLIRRPANSGSLDLNWKICPRLEANAEALFVGPMADDNFDDPSLPANVTVDGYTKLDLALRWHVRKNLEVFARAENLLDEHYQEVFGFPALGRGFYGGLRVQF